jgi:hypothetical protein
MESRRLAALSVGLGALGLTALLLVVMGVYRPEKTTLIQEIKTLKHKVPAAYDEKTLSPKPVKMVLQKPTEYKVVSKRSEKLALAVPKGEKVKLKGAKAKGQQLKLTFNGETPLGDDDFDAAGYNMEGVWDWKLGKFRSPVFKHEPDVEAYEDPESGDHLDVPACEPDDSLPKAILYDDCGHWPYWSWRYEYQCYYSWWGWWYGCWQREYHPLEMPDGGDHELPQGFYSTLGDTCYDDRPINIVKDRTRTEAAWMGGCELAGCVAPHTCSAISLPDGVNIALYSEPNFMGNTISLQGPVDIPCLVEWGWNDRIESVKVQNSIGLDATEPLPVDRIHGTDWIYPGGPDSSQSKYNVYFNQWDELDSSPHRWACLAGYKPGEEEDAPCEVDDDEGPDGTKPWISDGDGVDVVTPEPWQADVNNLY